MTEIHVDLAAVREMGRLLRGLQEEFESLDETVRGYDAAVGSPEVAAALEDFARNWSEKRRQVGKLIEKVAGYSTTAEEQYREQEVGLASGFGHAATGTAGGAAP